MVPTKATVDKPVIDIHAYGKLTEPQQKLVDELIHQMITQHEPYHHGGALIAIRTLHAYGLLSEYDVVIRQNKIAGVIDE